MQPSESSQNSQSSGPESINEESFTDTAGYRPNFDQINNFTSWRAVFLKLKVFADRELASSHKSNSQELSNLIAGFKKLVEIIDRLIDSKNVIVTDCHWTLVQLLHKSGTSIANPAFLKNLKTALPETSDIPRRQYEDYAKRFQFASEAVAQADLEEALSYANVARYLYGMSEKSDLSLETSIFNYRTLLESKPRHETSKNITIALRNANKEEFIACSEKIIATMGNLASKSFYSEAQLLARESCIFMNQLFNYQELSKTEFETAWLFYHASMELHSQVGAVQDQNQIISVIDQSLLHQDHRLTTKSWTAINEIGKIVFNAKGYNFAQELFGRCLRDMPEAIKSNTQEVVAIYNNNALALDRIDQGLEAALNFLAAIHLVEKDPELTFNEKIRLLHEPMDNYLSRANFNNAENVLESLCQQAGTTLSDLSRDKDVLKHFDEDSGCLIMFWYAQLLVNLEDKNPVNQDSYLEARVLLNKIQTHLDENDLSVMLTADVKSYNAEIQFRIGNFTEAKSLGLQARSLWESINNEYMGSYLDSLYFEFEVLAICPDSGTGLLANVEQQLNTYCSMSDEKLLYYGEWAVLSAEKLYEERFFNEASILCDKLIHVGRVRSSKHGRFLYASGLELKSSIELRKGNEQEGLAYLEKSIESLELTIPLQKLRSVLWTIRLAEVECSLGKVPEAISRLEKLCKNIKLPALHMVDSVPYAFILLSEIQSKYQLNQDPMKTLEKGIKIVDGIQSTRLQIDFDFAALNVTLLRDEIDEAGSYLSQLKTFLNDINAHPRDSIRLMLFEMKLFMQCGVLEKANSSERKIRNKITTADLSDVGRASLMLDLESTAAKLSFSQKSFQQGLQHCQSALKAYRYVYGTQRSLEYIELLEQMALALRRIGKDDSAFETYKDINLHLKSIGLEGSRFYLDHLYVFEDFLIETSISPTDLQRVRSEQEF